MARLEVLEVLDDIERKADGYLVLNTLINIGFNIFAIYASIELTTWISRALLAPC